MKKIDLAVLLSLGALWGGSFLFMRMGADAFGALPLAGLRAIGAALCFVPLLASRRRLAEWRAHWWPIAVIGVANSALPFLLFTFATRSLPAGLASIIDGMTPMFAALIGWLWLGQRLDAWRAAGLAAGFAGILWLAEGSLALAPGAGLALLACVAATVLYGYSVHYTHLRLGDVTPLVVTVGSHMVAALVLLPTTVLAWPTQAPPLQAWLAAAGLAVLCTALAYVLFFWVLARVGAVRIMVIPYLIPAFGVLWGGLLLDEPVTAPMLGGCAVILLGTALTTGLVRPRRRWRPGRHKAATAAGAGRDRSIMDLPPPCSGDAMRPMTTRLPLLLLALLCLAGLARPSFAQEEDGLLPVTEAYKLSADASTPGVLKLHWDIAPDYYLYRGRMKLKPADGVTLGEATFPDGEKHHDEYLGDVEIYHHAIDASVPYTVAPGSTRLRLGVQFQGCHEVDPKICYPPHTEQLDLALPAAGATAPAGGGSLGAALRKLGATHGSVGSDAPLPAEQAFKLEALAQDPRHLLLRWSMPPGYYLYRDQTRLRLRDGGGLTLTPQWPAGTRKDDPHFGSVTVYFNELDLPVSVAGDLAGRTHLALEASFQGCQDGGLCYPMMTRALDVELGSAAPASGIPATTAPEAPPATATQGPLQTSLWLALLLALGGGLVLNLMPCVLPVLSIKAVGLLESGESPARARAHALAYTAGVLLSFVALGLGILALRSAGHALGWGTQLQQPLLVGVLALVMLAVGLSMSGLVQFGTSLGNTGAGLASRRGVVGDFFTGVLAVVVASPCTAPFMGSALAYAFAAPATYALLVFLALGVGLALPFLAVGFVPALARRLPRPGRWMETLKQLLAFPMYLTAAWLAWVLANQRGADAVGLLLVAAVFLALTLWWFERSRGRSGLVRAPVLLAVLATAVPLYALAQLPPPVRAAQADSGTVAYSPEKLAELRAAGTPVFVDMTADWCVTCKANEHTVLDTDAFRALLERTGAVYMKGDWTDVNPTIAAFLEQYHSPGVPLYVVFPRGGGEGRKLPTVLTSGLVEQALTEAAR